MRKGSWSFGGIKKIGLKHRNVGNPHNRITFAWHAGWQIAFPTFQCAGDDIVLARRSKHCPYFAVLVILFSLMVIY